MQPTLSPRIDTIIFDLGGVLIDWNPRYLYRKIFVDPGAAEHFLSEICTPAWNHEQDAGRSWEEAIESKVAEFPEYEAEIRAYRDRWDEMLGGAIDETVELLHMLRGGRQYRLLALTNWASDTFQYTLTRFEFLSWFEGIVVSGDEGVAKPDPRIYQTLLDRYQVVPDRALFLDDSEKNVAAARRLGLHAVHFQSPMQLREELADWLARV